MSLLSLRSRWLGLLIGFAFPGAALATDGVLEINQACATNSTCFFGDTTSGYPVTIAFGGSYKLTGNLSVGLNTHAIEIFVDDVTLDLNGFLITGGSFCSGNGPTLTCGSGSGRAIEAPGRAGIRVRNGRIARFGNGGILAGDRAQMRDLTIEGNGGHGIEVGVDAQVSDVIASRNFGNGINALTRGRVKDSTVSANRFSGIEAGAECSLEGNTASANGSTGLIGGDGCALAGNVATLNTGGGQSVGIGGSIIGGVAESNTGTGLSANVGSTIADCTTSRNGGAGVSGGTSLTVKGCTARENGGTGVRGGVGSHISGVEARSNAGDGISVLFGSTVRENTVSTSDEVGIRAAGGSSVIDNTVFGNDKDGIHVQDACLVRGNHAARNGEVQQGGFNGAGIHATGGDNRIVGNTLTQNDIGILYDVLGSNTTTGNTADGNISNYLIGVGPKIAPIATSVGADPLANLSF